MLTDMQIAIIGGDARQLEVIRKLTELDAKLSLIGFEQLDHAFTGASKEKIDEVDFTQLDAIILPVAGTSMDGHVDTIFSNEKIMLHEDMVKITPEHCTIFSGITNPYLSEIIKKTKRRHVLLFSRDDVAIYNSIPTVEGTIMMAIQHTDITIHGSNVTVLGLGRVGMSVARAFHLLGSKVKVGARKPEHIARITEMGLTPFHLNDLANIVSDTDILINTIPHLIVTAKVITKLPVNTLIIDLASKAGRDRFQICKKRGIKALLAPSLPGIVAPKTAGGILANVLSKLLDEVYENRKEK